MTQHTQSTHPLTLRRTCGLLAVASAACTALSMASLAAPASADPPASSGHRREIAAARAATAPFHEFEAAAAGGYGAFPPTSPLAACIDMDLDLDDADGKPAMGIHYVNGSLIDGQVDAAAPEVVIYEPQADGSRRLVGVEYVAFEAALGGDPTTPGSEVTPPSLFGQQFTLTESFESGHANRYDLPAFYSLHAWLWRHNPDGIFAPMNPAVSCGKFVSLVVSPG